MKSIAYVTSSQFKVDEASLFMESSHFDSGERIDAYFSLDFRAIPIVESLEVNLETLVRAEALSAYQAIKVPCIVEHAGLIFSDYESSGYPGGLTKPMWNTLNTSFLKETHSRGRRAVARAVVGYCDGKSISTFVGDTQGVLSDSPRGARNFYWDTIFVPDSDDDRVRGRTYAEIVEDPGLGLLFKMTNLSQSGKALRAFFNHIRDHENVGLWSV